MPQQRGDRGAHGRFDAQAHATSPQVWLNTNRGLAAGAFALGVAAWLLATRRHA